MACPLTGFLAAPAIRVSAETIFPVLKTRRYHLLDIREKALVIRLANYYHCRVIKNSVSSKELARTWYKLCKYICRFERVCKAITDSIAPNIPIVQNDRGITRKKIYEVEP